MSLKDDIKDTSIDCEKILNTISELRNALVRKEDLEARLVETMLNQSKSEELEELLMETERKIAILEKDLKETLTRAGERMEMIKESYERIAEKYGGFKVIENES